jgi:hypothetical protein
VEFFVTSKYLASLNFLRDLLKPVISDSLKKSLKSKTSAERAEIRTIEIYKVLLDLGNSIHGFTKLINSFADYSCSIELSDDSNRDEIIKFKCSLIEFAERIKYSLEELYISLAKINPAFEIYQNELNTAFAATQGAGAQITKECRELIPDMYDGFVSPRQLKILATLARKATKNNKLLQKAIVDFREFIVREFPYKDHF